MVRGPEAGDPIARVFPDDAGGHGPEAVADQDVVDPAVEGSAELAQIVAVAARQADIVRVRLRPGILKARREQVGVRRRRCSVRAGVEVAEEQGRQLGLRGTCRELLALRDLGRVAERLEMRRDHTEGAAGDGCVR
jgi:hypothetical protein